MGGEYFLDDHENLNDLVEEYVFNKKQNWDFHQKIKESEKFTLWNYSDYSQKGVLVFKGKRLYDNLHRIIYSASEDLQTGKVKELIKFFYLEGVVREEDGYTVCVTFKYELDGKIKYVSIDDDIWGSLPGKPLEAEVYFANYADEKEFVWKEHPFYHSGLIEFPENDIL